jgi:hypothetical protein
MIMLGRSEIQYGYRVGGKVTWCSSKKDRDSILRKMNGNIKKGGPQAKAVQKRVPVTLVKKNPKDSCSGGKCKPNGRMCTKHGKKAGKDMEGLHTKDGRNRNNIRWDEEGFRW